MESRTILPETLASWQVVQDALAGISELELGLYDADGPVGSVSGECPFCTDMRSTNGGRTGCREQCAGFAREALRAGTQAPQFFRCRLGLKVFAVRLGDFGGSGLALLGGKTFGTRSDYDKAIATLRGAEVKVQNTGRHRYRFVGKKRLGEIAGSAATVAGQFLGLLSSVSDYRLKHNRQAALIENASLLHQVSDVYELVDGFMRALQSLFGFERLSMHLYALGDGERDRHFVRGADMGSLFSDADLFMDWMRRSWANEGGPLIVGGDGFGAPSGLSEEVSSAVCMPVLVSGELLGFVCVYDQALSRGDMESFRGYAQQISAAIDNRRLRTGVLDKLNRLKAMTALYSSAGTMQDPDVIYRLLLDKSLDLMKAERGSLMLLNEKTDELFVRFSKGISDEILGLAKENSGEGVAGFVAQTGSPVVVRDAGTEQRPGLSRRPEYKTDSFVSVPLKVRGRVVGVVNLTDKATGDSFDYDDLEFLLGLASYAGSALERTGPEELTGELEGIVVRDGLTGLLLRGHFNGRLAEEVERARRYGHRFSLMILDLDGYSGYVARNGRPAGNEALRRVSSMLVSSFRANDILSRYSEDRFAVALPETPGDKAVALADRIRRRVEAARFPDKSMADSARLTVSIGVSEFPSDADKSKPLFDDALAALDDARRGGGNLVRRSGGDGVQAEG